MKYNWNWKKENQLTQLENKKIHNCNWNFNRKITTETETEKP